LNFSLRIRISNSIEEPDEEPTTTVIGRDGKMASSAIAPPAAATAKRKLMDRAAFIMWCPLLF
jgi:hypothetical protein